MKIINCACSLIPIAIDVTEWLSKKLFNVVLRTGTLKFINNKICCIHFVATLEGKKEVPAEVTVSYITADFINISFYLEKEWSSTNPLHITSDNYTERPSFTSYELRPMRSCNTMNTPSERNASRNNTRIIRCDFSFRSDSFLLFLSLCSWIVPACIVSLLPSKAFSLPEEAIKYGGPLWMRSCEPIKDLSLLKVSKTTWILSCFHKIWQIMKFKNWNLKPTCLPGLSICAIF